jgi:hypothetical protein
MPESGVALKAESLSRRTARVVEGSANERSSRSRGISPMFFAHSSENIRSISYHGRDWSKDVHGVTHHKIHP